MVNSASVKSLLARLSDELQAKQGSSGTTLPSFAVSLDESLLEIPAPGGSTLPKSKDSVGRSDLPRMSVPGKVERKNDGSSERLSENNLPQGGLNHPVSVLSSAPIKTGNEAGDQMPSDLVMPVTKAGGDVSLIAIAKPVLVDENTKMDAPAIELPLEPPAAKPRDNKEATISAPSGKAKTIGEKAHKTREIGKAEKHVEVQGHGELKAPSEGQAIIARNQQTFVMDISAQQACVTDDGEKPKSDVTSSMKIADGTLMMPRKAVDSPASNGSGKPAIPRNAVEIVATAGDVAKGESVGGQRPKPAIEHVEANTVPKAGMQIEGPDAVQNAPVINLNDRLPFHIVATGDGIHSATQATAKEASTNGMQQTSVDASSAPLAERNTGAVEHRTLSATPSMLEVGVANGSNGWLKIRAELTESGAVKAALSSSSASGQEMLHRELPALSGFLDQERVPVSSLVVHANAMPMYDATGPSTFDGAAGQQAPGNHAGGNHQDRPRELGSFDEIPLPKDVGELQPIDFVQSSNGLSGGSWVSVRA